MLGISVFLFSFIVPETEKVELGIASFYHSKFNGRKTSSGEIFSNKNLTAAHKKLPIGTWVKVTNLKNDSSIIVRINDRLPSRSKRIIDLSHRAAQQLNFIRAGLAKVKIEVLTPVRDSLMNEISFK